MKFLELLYCTEKPYNAGSWLWNREIWWIARLEYWRCIMLQLRVLQLEWLVLWKEKWRQPGLSRSAFGVIGLPWAGHDSRFWHGVVMVFSSLARILGECSTIHSLLLLFFFFVKWRLGRTHWFYSLGQDQSTVAQRAETTVAKCSLTNCVWAHFWIGFHTMHRQRQDTK